MVEHYWTASARRRRWILRRYGRGPKKKPPDQRVKQQKENSARFVPAKHRRRHAKPLRLVHCNLRWHQATPNILCYHRYMAPFLAGSRRSYKHISKTYWTLSRAAIPIDGNHHGYIKRLRQNKTKFSQSAHQKFGFDLTALVRNFNTYVTEGFKYIKTSINEVGNKISNQISRLVEGFLDWRSKIKYSILASFSNKRAQTTISDTHGTKKISWVKSNWFKGLTNVRKKWASAIPNFSWRRQTSKTFKTDETDASIIKTASYMSKESSSLSSIALLSQEQPLDYCIECNSALSRSIGHLILGQDPKTRSSSIAEDETTLCPSIPQHIFFRELDDITVGSSPTIFGNRYLPSINMGGGMEHAARMDHDDYSNAIEEHQHNQNGTSLQVAAASTNGTSNNGPSTNASNSNGLELIVDQLKMVMTQFEGMRNEMKKSDQKAQVQRELDRKRLDELTARLDAKMESSASNEPQKANDNSSNTVSSGSSYSATAAAKTTTEEAKKHQEQQAPPKKTPPTTANKQAQASPNRPPTKSDLQEEENAYFFPVGETYDEIDEHDLLWIKASAFGKKIKKLRQMDANDDGSDLSYNEIGNLFIAAIHMTVPNIKVELKKAFELSVKSENKDDKCVGQIAIKLVSEYNFTEIQQLRKLKEAAQAVIFSNACQQVESNSIKGYAKAFHFEINAVNYPYQMVAALIHGIEASTFDKSDHIGLDNLMQELMKHVPVNHVGMLPLVINSQMRQWERLGAMIYTSSSVKTENRNGRAIAICYARTKNGEKAAFEFFKAFQDSKISLIFGELPVTVECFPVKSTSSSPRKRQGIGRTLDRISTFVKDTIKHNQTLCTSNYKVITITDLNDQVFEYNYVLDTVCSSKHVIAAIPVALRGQSKAGNILNFGYQLFLRRGSTTLSLSDDFFRSQIRSIVPYIFPLEETKLKDDGFIKVQNKRGKSTQVSAKKQTTLHDTMKDVDSAATRIVLGGKQFILVRKGKGGRRVAGVYEPEDWFKPLGTRFRVLGVSGALYKGYDTRDEAWEGMNYFFPGVVDPETLAQFHASIPHTETNLSPTHSHRESAPFHRPGAIAYTFCETDSQEMLEARMAAMLRITGTEDGPIDKREYFEMFTPQETKADNDTKTGEDDTAKEESANDVNNAMDIEDDEEEEEDFTHSQDLRHAMGLKNDDGNSETSEQNKASPKKRKVDSPTAASSISTHNDGLPFQIKTKTPVDTQLLAMALPPQACLFDAKAYLIKFHKNFGYWYENQVKLGQYAPFQGWSAIIECPVGMVTDFLDFTKKTPMFGKYQCTIERVLNPDNTVTYIPVNNTLETLAENYLVQYVKHATHPKHDKDLELQLLDIKNGTQLMQYYCTYWAKDGDFQEGKTLAEPIIIPQIAKPNPKQGRP